MKATRQSEKTPTRRVETTPRRISAFHEAPQPKKTKVLNEQHHDPAKQLDVDALVVRVVALAQALSEVKFYDYQVEATSGIVRSLLMHDGDVITALMSRQIGKSECLGAIVTALAVILPYLAKLYPDSWHLNITDNAGNYRGFAHGLKVGIYAPRLDQAKFMFERVRKFVQTDTAKKILKELGLVQDVNNGNAVVLSNYSRVLCESASEQSKIEGATHHLLVLDEAQDISDMKVKKCFAYDTEFVGEDGTFVQIDSIVRSKRNVLTPHGFVTPVEWHDNGVQPVYELETDCGRTLRVTGNHQNLVLTRTRRKPFMSVTSDIKVGWRIAVPDSIPVFGDMGSYSEGYFVGTILGDGCTGGGRIQFVATEQQARKLSRFVKDRDCHLVKGKQLNGVCEYRVAENRHCQGSVIGLFKWLGLFGVTGKDKFIPNKPWSKNFLRGLIEGLFETDGCVEQYASRPVVSFTNISRQLVYRLGDYLLRFGIHSAIHSFTTVATGSLKSQPKGKVCRAFRLHVKGNLDIVLFGKNFDLGIKQSKLKMASKWCSSHGNRARSDAYPSSVRFDRIRRVNKVGSSHTYCVTVATDDHLLTTNGFVSSNSLHPMVASTKGTIVKIGTATVRRCDFYSAIQTNKRLDSTDGKRRHFFYPQSVAIKYNSLYADYIRQERVRLGEDSDEYRTSYNCEWVFERGMFVTHEQLFDAEVALRGGIFSLNHMALRVNQLPREFSHFSVVAGLDWGVSYDSTVLTLMAVNWNAPLDSGVTINKAGAMSNYVSYKKHVLGWMDFIGDNYEEQYGAIFKVLTSHMNLKKVTMDSNACGRPMFDRFQASLSPLGITVEPLPFNMKAKSDAYKLLYGDICGRRLTFPASASVASTIQFRRFRDQMLDLRKTYKETFMCVAHPEEKGAHDDYPDSLACACWGANTPTERTTIELSDGNPFYAR